MSTSQEFAEFVIENLDSDLNISYRKMFGEYALYSNDKVVALICNDQLFIKPTNIGRKFIDKITEKPPYPNAKPYFLIADIENKKWLSRLIFLTERELLLPKKKRKK